jgi:hypothetical protein
MLPLPLVLSALALAPTSPSPPAAPIDPRDGRELIALMHDRYAGAWYRTLTFVQRTTLSDGSVQTWYESIATPGLLRIDIAPLDSMNTLLFRNDSMYEFRGGKRVRSDAQIHPLMVLGFDVYAQPAGETVRKLTTLGFDLSTLHETTWQGRATYVVGAEHGDSSSTQFWIDKERLYFVRSIEPSRRDPSVRVDTRFEKYIPMARGWLETEVLFLVNGAQRGKEEYSEPNANVILDPAIFEPDEWRAPGWVR